MRSPSVLPLQALSVHLLLPVHANIVNSAYRWDERGPTSVISRYPVKDSSFFSVLTLAVYTFSTSAFTCDKASFIEYMRSSSGFFAAADRVRICVLMTVAMDALCGDVSEESKLNKDKEQISPGNALESFHARFQAFRAVVREIGCNDNARFSVLNFNSLSFPSSDASVRPLRLIARKAGCWSRWHCCWHKRGLYRAEGKTRPSM